MIDSLRLQVLIALQLGDLFVAFKYGGRGDGAGKTATRKVSAKVHFRGNAQTRKVVD
jgi:hypothetical protein